MGGFLSGLGTLLGGFNAQRRIDKEGFDWKEQADQQEAMRKRQTQEWQQSDEDRAQSQLTDYMSAQDLDAEPDVAGAEPLMSGVDVAKRKAFITTALGRRKQQKDYLESLKGQSRMELEGVKSGYRKEEIPLREEAKAPGREDTQAHQTELLRQRLEAMEREGSLNREMARTLAEIRATSGPGRKTSYTKLSGSDEQGRAGTWLIDNVTGEREFMPSGPTAATRGKEESKGAARNAYDELMGVYDKIGGQSEGGLEARGTGLLRKGQAAAGYAPEVNTYQSGVRGFVPLMARALGHVGVLTELDVERTESLFPKVGDTNQEKIQKKRLLEDIMSGRKQLPFRFERDTRGVGEVGAPRGGGEHGPAVKRRRLPDGRTQFRDAQGNVWEE